MEPVTARLKALRASARPKVSIREMANALGMPPGTYAFYEDRAKFKKPIIPLDLAKRIADVLEPGGVDRAAVLGLAGLTGEFSAIMANQPEDNDDEWVEVSGSVVAGVWRAQSDWPAAERYSVRFGPSKYPKFARFAVKMEGLSMNKTILHGSDLECLWVKFSPIQPKVGDLVIVERHRHELVELTCKRLAMDGDDYILLSESTEKEFQEPIHIGRPDENMFTDDEVRVVGIVLSSKQDLAPKGLSERRYIRER